MMRYLYEIVALHALALILNLLTRCAIIGLVIMVHKYGGVTRMKLYCFDITKIIGAKQTGKAWQCSAAIELPWAEHLHCI